MDVNVEDVSSGETIEKVTPPVVSKRGRKLGQKTGTGVGRKSKAARARVDAKKAPALSPAEAIEAIADKGKPEADKAGTDRPTTRRKAAVTVEKHKLGKTMQGLYKGASMLTGIDEFDIGEDKANALASAMLDMFAEFDIEISSKSAAVANFAGTMMYVHAPIALAVRSRQTRRVRPAQPATSSSTNPEHAPPPIEPVLDANFFDQTQGG
jgi:hypothetical protein